MTAIAVGASHSLALKSDGTVWPWGRNNYGQLGDRTTTTRTTPVRVSNLSGLTVIAAGYYHSLAVKSNETAWAWGYNGFGQLGDGTMVNHTTPILTNGLEGTKYYYFNGQRVAMRREGVLYYLAGDHLGTTSLVLDASGNKVAESRRREAFGSAVVRMQACSACAASCWASLNVPVCSASTSANTTGSPGCIDCWSLGPVCEGSATVL